MKARKLDEDFNGSPRVDQLSETYLMALYDREIGRLLREGAISMKTVRTARADSVSPPIVGEPGVSFFPPL